MTVDPEETGVVWIDGQRAVIVRWDDGPALEKLESGVPPKRRAVGSVRRGPARPHGGGRVAGHGTQGRHKELLQQYLAEIAERVADLDAVEVSGRGEVHQQFAALLENLVQKGDGKLEVTTRTLARRPSDRQMAARFRRIAGEELPRRRSGSYRPPPDRLASGRIRPPTRADLPNPRPRHLPEHKVIELEIEMMLADDSPV